MTRIFGETLECQHFIPAGSMAQDIYHIILEALCYPQTIKCLVVEGYNNPVYPLNILLYHNRASIFNKVKKTMIDYESLNNKI